MQIIVGTYQGSLVFLNTNFQKIVPVKNMQISENSIKSICLVGGNNLVVGGYDQEVKVVDLNNYQETVQAKENVGQITKICQVNDTLFAIGVDDGTIRLWSTQSWSIINQARSHKKAVTGISCTNEKVLFTAGGNKIILWSAQNLKKAHEYKFQQDISIENIRITENLKWILYSNSKNQVWLMITQNNQKSLKFTIPLPRKIQDLVIFQNFIIIGNDIGEIFAWQLFSDSGQVLEIDYNNRIWFKAHNARIKQIKIIDNSYLVIATAGGEISVWDFPQFLSSVQKVSQEYYLEGLKSLCQIKIKGRILCLEVRLETQVQKKKEKKEVQAKQEQQIWQDQQKEENIQEKELTQDLQKRKDKKRKNKLIKKQKILEIKKKQFQGEKKKP